MGQLAIQGPAAEAVIQRMTEIDLSSIETYRFASERVLGSTAVLWRGRLHR